MHDPAQLNAALTGRYEIEREVGQGGMATVYLAKDLKHNRHVALKVLSSELAAVVGRERFLSEIEVTANLHHPHLLPLFDSGDAGGLLFYVMPYVEGESLRKRLERERQLSMDEAVHIAGAVGSALDYAHRHGVIHRDLKPENILMHEREPLVMDFGIALAVSNAGGARVTQAGISLGTPQYMSPEQATGDRPIDARSDIYSLGALTYELIAGEPPHTGSSIQSIMAKVITDRPESLRAQRDTVPPHVEDAVMRALAKLPADRFATAADFVSALTSHRSVAVSISESQVFYASEVRQLPITPVHRPLVTRRGLGLLGATVLLAAAGGAFGVRAMRKTDPGAQYRFVLDLSDSMPTSNTRYRQVALSRDGSRAVFQFTPLWPGPLYTRRMGEMHFDVIPGSDSARSVVISPDGKEILFWLGDNTGNPAAATRLMKLPVEGGAPVQVADSATPHTQATWGDLHQVIFRRDDHLVLVSDDGGAERMSYWPDTTNHQFALGWPEFLPGGKAALVTVNRARSAPTDSQYVGVLNLADGKVTDLNVRGFTPHFAQGHVLWVRADGQLYARPFDVNKLRFTGEARAIAKDLNVRGIGSDQERGATDLAVSETGLLLFTDGGPTIAGGGGGGGGRYSIVRRKGAGQNPDWLQVPQLPYRDLRASPDGSMLALTIADTASTARTDIYLLTFATGNLRRLTRDGKSSQPVWSPDGKRVVFRVTDPAGKPIRRFYSQPWNESEPPKPIEGADGAEAVEFPGPQGKYIAYVRGDSGLTDNLRTNSDIYIAPIDSPAAQRPFAATGIRERKPRFSPDGKWLAYIGHELPSGGAAQVGGGILYVREVPGPGPVIPVSVQFGLDPLWAADGRSLFYFSGGGAAPFTAARLAKGSDFKIAATQEAFGRPNPGTGFGFPAGLWHTDIMPNGDVLYLSITTPPPVVAQPIAGGLGVALAAAAALDVEFRVIAMVNWLGAERPAGSKR